MRGKAVPRKMQLLQNGITPAYAGKSYGRYTDQRKDWDHPRLCGEKLEDILIRRYLEGSPPPMRGKDRVALRKVDHDRITPAYAGKRAKAWKMRFPQRDHPRLCGEKTHEAACILRHTGSPPPMRGKAHTSVFPRSSVRITPAYAGKRVTRGVADLWNKDHPRLCGEKGKPCQSEM